MERTKEGLFKIFRDSCKELGTIDGKVFLVYLQDTFLIPVENEWVENECLHIEKTSIGYYLHIANNEYENKNLEGLEYILFDWAISEGYLDAYLERKD